MNLCITNPRNRHYRYAIKKEIEIESQAKLSVPASSMELHPIVNSYRNSEIIGKSSTGEMDYFDLFVNKQKAVKLGLSLGTGLGRHQTEMVRRGFVEKWDSFDLLIQEEKLFGKYKENMDLNTGDLNFIELPESKYPLVFCHGVLHHIINLEHLLFQINKSLTSDGIFILYEYVGETKQQWDSNKIDIIQQKIFNPLSKKYPELNLQMKKEPILNSRPLESVRSQEIPALIHKIFSQSTEFEYLGFPVLYPALNQAARLSKAVFNDSHLILEDFLNTSIKLDMELKGNSLFRPTLLFGIYRKSISASVPKVNAWTRKEIRFNLSSKKQFVRRIKSRLMRNKLFRKFNEFRKNFAKR